MTDNDERSLRKRKHGMYRYNIRPAERAGQGRPLRGMDTGKEDFCPRAPITKQFRRHRIIL